MLRDPNKPSRKSRTKMAAAGTVVTAGLVLLAKLFDYPIPEGAEEALAAAVAALIGLAQYFQRDATPAP